MTLFFGVVVIAIIWQLLENIFKSLRGMENELAKSGVQKRPKVKDIAKRAAGSDTKPNTRRIEDLPDAPPGTYPDREK